MVLRPFGNGEPVGQSKLASDVLLNATCDFGSWPTALRSLAREFHADHGFAYVVTPEATHAFASRGSEEVLAAVVADNWQERNPRMQRGLEFARSGPVGLLTDWRLFSREEIARDPFEQELACRHDLVHYAGTFIPFAKNSFLVVSFERSDMKGTFRGSELDFVTASIEQARQSVTYALKAQAQLATGLVDALSNTGPAHAWLGGDGSFKHASSAFVNLIDRFVGIRNGKVRALHGNDSKLQWLVDAAAKGNQTNETVSLKSQFPQDGIAIARALPMPTIHFGLTSYADVLLSLEVEIPRARTISGVLRTRFGLTPSEVNLALRLNEGASLRHAADAEHISYETARTRLKVIFGKMHVTRQAELVRRMSQLSDN